MLLYELLSEFNFQVTRGPENDVVSMRNQIFTCIAFEVISNPVQKQRHVYVASASGTVYQVSYER